MKKDLVILYGIDWNNMNWVITMFLNSHYKIKINSFFFFLSLKKQANVLFNISKMRFF